MEKELTRDEMVQAIVDASGVDRGMIEGLPDDLLEMHYERFCQPHKPNLISPAQMLREQEALTAWVAAGNELEDFPGSVES